MGFGNCFGVLRCMKGSRFLLGELWQMSYPLESSSEEDWIYKIDYAWCVVILLKPHSISLKNALEAGRWPLPVFGEEGLTGGKAQTSRN